MCMEEQNMLGTEERVTKFLGILSEEDLRNEVKAIFDKHSTSVKRWEAFVNNFREQIQSVSINSNLAHICFLMQFINNFQSQHFRDRKNGVGRRTSLKK